MDQADLIRRIAENLHISGALSKNLLRATLLEICELLKNGEAVSIPGLGTFDTALHEQRQGFLPSGFQSSGSGYALFPKRRVPVFARQNRCMITFMILKKSERSYEKREKNHL